MTKFNDILVRVFVLWVVLTCKCIFFFLVKASIVMSLIFLGSCGSILSFLNEKYGQIIMLLPSLV